MSNICKRASMHKNWSSLRRNKTEAHILAVITTCTSICECTVADFQYSKNNFFLKVYILCLQCNVPCIECLTHVFI